MCGIYGYIGTPKRPEEAYRMMKSMAIATEVRGIHSSGFAAINDENFFSKKLVVRATEFYKQIDVKHVIDNKTYLFVGHNRWASIGKISEENAHPFVGEKYLFVHNGTCPFAKVLANKLGLVSKGDTDSECLMNISEKYGFGSLRRFHDLSIVAIDYKNSSGHLYFYRDYLEPMVICDIRKWAGIILFASTKEIIKKGIEEMTVWNVKYFLDKSAPTIPGIIYRYNKFGNGKVVQEKKKLPTDIKEAMEQIKKEKEITERKEIYHENYHEWEQSYDI